MIEERAALLRIKPSVLAAMILKDCTSKWVEDYTKDVYNKIHGGDSD